MNKLFLERLEERIVPDGDPIMMPPPIPEAFQVSLNMGTLTITGTAGEEDVKIEREVDVNGDFIYVWNNGVLKASPPTNLVNFINVSLKGGNDKLLCENIYSGNNNFQGMWASGDGGNDELTTAITATLDGGDGNDTINGSGGADVVWGGSGNDVINANGGDDIVSGGADNDTILARSGDDLVWGDGGDDTISGGEGADRIYGGSGNDVLSGNYLANELNIYKIDENDPLMVNEVYGEDGNDILYSNGVTAASYYSGGDGDDEIHGETLNGASMTGGTGFDIIYSNLTAGKSNTINTNDGEIDAISANNNDTLNDDVFDVYF